MRIIDILGLIAYPLLIIDAILLFIYMAKSLSFQLKNKVLSWLIILIFFSTVFFSIREIFSTIIRYIKINGVSQHTINQITDWYIIISFILSVFFTALMALLYTRNNDRVIQLPRRKKDNK